jgi:hypothetical protein
LEKRDITFIIPYFGAIPLWMPVFLKSCHANPDFTFLILSDVMPEGRRKNVKVVRMTLAELKVLASEKLDMPVSLESPYKVCDLRPAFGLIFEDYLKTSSFWGTCDVDMILGNIRNFFPDELLRNYDVVTAKREYLIGHFTLFRNIKRSTGYLWRAQIIGKYSGVRVPLHSTNVIFCGGSCWQEKTFLKHGRR